MARSETYNLLLVDDEPNILSSLKRLFLELPDTEVFTAESAVEASKILKQDAVDLVISDERMPKIEGHKFVQFVKKHYPDTLRIILTGYSDMEAMREAVNRGDVYRYLFKPWDDNELLVIVRNALEHARVGRERDQLNKQLTELVHKRTDELQKALEYIKRQQQETEESLKNTFVFLDNVISMIGSETTTESISNKIARLARVLAEAQTSDASTLRLCEMASYFFQIGALSLGKGIDGTIDSRGKIVPEVLEMSDHLIGRTLKVRDLAAGIRHIREHWNGSGHPDGLSHEEIPLVSRAVRIAFDYYAAVDLRNLDGSEAVEMLRIAAGRVYDPALAEHAASRLSEQSYTETTRLRITKLVPGLVLGYDLKLDNGMTYLAAGTVLSPEMVESVVARVKAPQFPLSAERDVLIRKRTDQE
ncbi:MAG: response regulator [Spirochaeta sp.]|nr:response regulator [Spirochaeta sp.]